jgi:hypothetical protein
LSKAAAIKPGRRRREGEDRRRRRREGDKNKNYLLARIRSK